jgi:transcriptional regulator with XRE-family HTH domain
MEELNVFLRNVGDNVRRLRSQKKMTQEALAYEANLNPAFFGRVERGQKNATTETWYKIANVLDVPMMELFAVEKQGDYHLQAIAKIKVALNEVSDEDADRIARIVSEIVQMRKNIIEAKQKEKKPE